MLSLEESLKILKETNALIEGHFILSSGLHSSKYIQCAQLMSKPNLASKICNSLAQKISKEDVNKAYIKIQKKIHPDISPETARLSSIVNEAKEVVLRDIS